jgi:hypothetical protein
MFKLPSLIQIGAAVLFLFTSVSRASVGDQAHIAAVTSHEDLDKLLFVFDVSSHGSINPRTNVIGNQGSTSNYNPGMLTQFGARQMYLRGREMRQRYFMGN